MVPTYEPAINILDSLRNYDQHQFILDLIEPEPNVLVGKLRFKEALGLSVDATATGDEVKDRTNGDLNVVISIERQLRSAMSFSYADGRFTFGAIVSCVDDRIAVAEQLLQHYAIAFLQTLGPLVAVS